MTTNKTLLAITAALALFAAAPAAAQAPHSPRGSSAPHTTAVPAAHTEHAAPRAPSSATADGVVNIQTATAEQLQLLPGIGPSKAEAIVAFRTAHPFQRVEDILRVRGIGRATFRRLRSMITVSGATTMTTDVRLGRATPAAHGSEAAHDDDAD